MLIKTSVLAVVAVMTAAIVVPGASAADKVPTYKGDGSKIRLLYAPSGTSTFPPYVIKKFELGKKYGFEMELLPYTTIQVADTAIRSGAVDIGLFQWPDIARMRNAGLNIVGIAPFLRWGADFVVVPVNSPIKTLGDLRGKTLGEYSRASLNSIIEHAVAKKIYNIDLEKDATVQEGAMPLLLGLLEQGKVDAADVFNSLEPGLVVSGKYRDLVKVSDLVAQLKLPETPYLMYAAEEGYAKAHVNNIKAFLEAYREAIDILNKDDAVWIEQGKELKMSEAESALFRKEARTDIRSKFDPHTEANIHKVFDLILETAGSKVLGLTELKPGFMTLDYQQ
jgi:NitT/TauT family transport system substrate-binding protein